MNTHYIKTSWCKMCVSEDNRKRNKRRKTNEYKENKGT